MKSGACRPRAGFVYIQGRKTYDGDTVEIEAGQRFLTKRRL